MDSQITEMCGDHLPQQVPELNMQIEFDIVYKVNICARGRVWRSKSNTLQNSNKIVIPILETNIETLYYSY